MSSTTNCSNNSSTECSSEPCFVFKGCSNVPEMLNQMIMNALEQKMIMKMNKNCFQLMNIYRKISYQQSKCTDECRREWLMKLLWDGESFDDFKMMFGVPFFPKNREISKTLSYVWQIEEFCEYLCRGISMINEKVKQLNSESKSKWIEMLNRYTNDVEKYLPPIEYTSDEEDDDEEEEEDESDELEEPNREIEMDTELLKCNEM
jgi:hypothetical protein